MKNMEQPKNDGNKLDEFMKKYLKKKWPVTLVRVCGVIQLILSLGIGGLDVMIILRSAVRWETFAGCWTAAAGLAAAIAGFITTTETTWLKVKWSCALNVIAALAALLLTNFNLIILINPIVCIKIGPCNFSAGAYYPSVIFYVIQAVLGFILILTTFLMLYIFLRDGMEGVDQFEAKQTEKALAADSEKNPKPTVIQPPYAASPDMSSMPPEFAPYGYPEMPNDQAMRYGSPSFTHIHTSQPVGYSEFDNGFVPTGASVPQYFYPEPSSTPYYPSEPMTPPYY